MSKFYIGTSGYYYAYKKEDDTILYFNSLEDIEDIVLACREVVKDTVYEGRINMGVEIVASLEEEVTQGYGAMLKEYFSPREEILVSTDTIGDWHFVLICIRYQVSPEDQKFFNWSRFGEAQKSLGVMIRELTNTEQEKKT